MQVNINRIPVREVLHFLGWRGTPVEPELLARIDAICKEVIGCIRPYIVMKRFLLEEGGDLRGASFAPAGEDVGRMLAGCNEAILLAATLGAQSERMLLREQARSSDGALLLDAVLSAAIESVCDHEESRLRRELEKERLYLTDRFSPGYGDMPIAQTKEICAVLDTPRAIGLTVSSSGIMIPRKSVTAIMGISGAPVSRRPSPCALCSAKERCSMRRIDEKK